MSPTFDEETICLGIFSAFASQKAEKEGERPKDWLESMDGGIKRTFPDFNYIIYDRKITEMEEVELKDIFFEDLFILGASLYFVVLFRQGSVALPEKYLESELFAYGGPRIVKIEAAESLENKLLKLTFENSCTLERKTIFSQAYQRIKKKVPTLGDIVFKAEEETPERITPVHSQLRRDTIGEILFYRDWEKDRHKSLVSQHVQQNQLEKFSIWPYPKELEIYCDEEMEFSETPEEDPNERISAFQKSEIILSERIASMQANLEKDISEQKKTLQKSTKDPNERIGAFQKSRIIRNEIIELIQAKLKRIAFIQNKLKKFYNRQSLQKLEKDLNERIASIQAKLEEIVSVQAMLEKFYIGRSLQKLEKYHNEKMSFFQKSEIILNERIALIQAKLEKDISEQCRTLKNLETDINEKWTNTLQKLEKGTNEFSEKYAEMSFSSDCVF